MCKCKRILSVGIIVAMLVCMLPANVFADTDTGTDTGIDVYVTFFNSGEFCKDKDSKLMWQRPVTVTDTNADGKYSVDEALLAAHIAYHPDGAAAYDGGSFVHKLWGVETTVLGFFRNDVATDAVNIEYMDKGDYLTAFIYYDKDCYSDRYSFFTEGSKTVEAGTAFNLTLKGSNVVAQTAGIPVAGAPIGVYNMETGAYSVPDTLKNGDGGTPVATGSDGSVSMQFTEPGVYYVTAQYNCEDYEDDYENPNYLVPPVCVVTVVENVVQDVEDKINAIGTVDENSGDKISAARDAYNALTDEQKALVTNYAVLTSAEAEFNKILANEAVTVIDTVADYLSGQIDYAYGDEWAIYALTRAGKQLSDSQIQAYYTSVAAEAATWDKDTAPLGLARTALALTVLGKDITNVEGVNLAELIYNSACTFNKANIYTYSLLAMDAAKINIPDDAQHTRDEMIEGLLGFQNSDNGGFFLTRSLNASATVDTTAMALQALAPYANSSNVKVANAASIGVLFLLNNITDASFGFASADGSTGCETVAQVILALAVNKLDPVNYGFGDEGGASIITNLMKYYNPQTGAFKHAQGGSDTQMATIQALEALEAYRRFQANEDSYWQVVSSTPETSETPSVTPEVSETPSVTPGASETPSVTPTGSETPSVTPGESETPSVTPAESGTPSVTPAESETPSVTPAESETPSPNPSSTPKPSVTPSPEPKTPVKDDNAKVTSGSADVKGATVSTTKSGTASLVALKRSAVKNKKSVTIPKTVTVNGVKYQITVVKTNAFKNASNATKITLPNSVVKIQKGAFNGVKKLKTVTLQVGSKKLTIAKNAFNKTNKNVKTINFKNLKKSSSVSLKAGSLKNLNKKAVIKVSKKMTKKELNKFIKALKKAGFKNASKKNVKKSL